MKAQFSSPTNTKTQTPLCDPVSHLSVTNDDRDATGEVGLKSDEQPAGAGATSISLTHTYAHTQVDDDGWFSPIFCLLCALFAQEDSHHYFILTPASIQFHVLLYINRAQ